MNGTHFTLIALASSVFAAIANILARTILREVKAQDMLSVNFFTIGATLVLFSPLFYFFNATYQSMALLMLIAIIDTAANYFYFKTFEKTEAGVATPLLSLAPAFTFFFAWIVLDERTTPLTVITTFLIIFLTIFFSASKENLARFRSATLTPALLASLLFGISAIPAKILLTSLHAINAPTLYMFRAGFIALLSLLFFNFSIATVTTKQYRKIFFRSLFVIAQWLLLYYALSIGHSGVTLTLGNVTPIFVFVLGTLFLHEHITVKKVVTAGLILSLSLLLA